MTDRWRFFLVNNWWSFDSSLGATSWSELSTKLIQTFVVHWWANLLTLAIFSWLKNKVHIFGWMNYNDFMDLLNFTIIRPNNRSNTLVYDQISLDKHIYLAFVLISKTSPLLLREFCHASIRILLKAHLCSLTEQTAGINSWTETLTALRRISSCLVYSGLFLCVYETAPFFTDKKDQCFNPPICSL